MFACNSFGFSNTVILSTEFEVGKIELGTFKVGGINCCPP